MAKDSRDQGKTRSHQGGAGASASGPRARQRAGTTPRGGGRVARGRTPEPTRGDATAPRASERGGPDERPREDVRERIERELGRAREQMQRLGVSAETHEADARAEAGSLFEEGDAAQASERRDLTFMTRERLTDRINRLIAALERLRRGVYGTCEVCGNPIEPQRLAALPEAATCLRCQEARERGEEAA
jgi:RNA polymerase-binding transcription factor DksA